MPPHLHPRSKFTSSLFATTLFASFFVVALPHALPCPAPHIAYADTISVDASGRPRRRRRKCPVDEEEKEEESNSKLHSFDNQKVDIESEGTRLQKRECPVPKPGGIVGEILGFKAGSSGNGNEKGSKPP
ncbi:alpha-13-mannosyltransferase (Alg3) protein [Rutstroemia sp. NJR-2017a BVV2]|nr:alpha-13-mannosyltransferase (Alg3) protein [Rutstroemia sp. NJR-2017a BVV2]